MNKPIKPDNVIKPKVKSWDAHKTKRKLDSAREKELRRILSGYWG